ncbi:MAG: hypothetical protein WB037_24120, partial [Pseudolabrys sp.]
HPVLYVAVLFRPEIQVFLTNHKSSDAVFSHPVARSSVGDRVGKIMLSIISLAAKECPLSG